MKPSPFGMAAECYEVGKGGSKDGILRALEFLLRVFRRGVDCASSFVVVLLDTKYANMMFKHLLLRSVAPIEGCELPKTVVYKNEIPTSWHSTAMGTEHGFSSVALRFHVCAFGPIFRL